MFENISWKHFIPVLESKLSRAIGILYGARPHLNEINHKQLYYSLLHSHLVYANISWGSTHPTKLMKLRSLQKHACKRTFYKILHSTGDSMKKLKALNVFELNIMQNLIFVFKYKMNLLPPIFANFFEIHSSKKHNLRSNYLENFILPPKKSKLTENTVSYRGPKLWNSLIESEIQNAMNINIFREKLTEFLLFSNKRF